MGGISRTVGRQYDADGNRIRVTHPDANYFTYDYDDLDRMKAIKQSGSTQVGSYDYDWTSQRWHAARGVVLTTYGYDGVSRLTSLADDLSGTGADISSAFTYNSASQIINVGRNNNSYVYAAYLPETKAYAVNGLNQYTAVSGLSLGYDSNGNLASNGGTSFTYDVENRLVSATGSLATAMVYDPLGRLYQTSSSSGIRQFLYDGDERIAEYDGASGALLRRYVHGPGDDDPQLWYEGSGLTDRRSLQSNHHGSIVSSADASGNVLAIKGYDEYGVSSGGDVGAFQYTGQAWLPDLGMYYYKARIYSAKLGRFLQTDPIGYADRNNLYAYVGNDPVNARDPDGTFSCPGIFCRQVTSAQSAALSRLANVTGQIKRLAETLKNGGKLSAAQVALQSRIDTFIGKGSSRDQSTLGALVDAGNGAISALRSGVRMDYDDTLKDDAQAPNRNTKVGGKFGPAFVNSSFERRQGTLAHEGFHYGFGAKDKRFTNISNPYGIDNAMKFARYGPSVSMQNADNLKFAFGFTE